MFKSIAFLLVAAVVATASFAGAKALTSRPAAADCCPSGDCCFPGSPCCDAAK